MALYADIGQGVGLAGATGVRPFLPALLAGGLARGDIGLDFDGSGWRFLESPGFLLAVFALALLSYGAERSGANRSARQGSDTVGAAVGEPSGEGRDPLRLALAGLGVVIGGLLFAGTLAEAGKEGWPGLLAGAACALLAWAALGRLFERAARRLEPSAAALIGAYAEGAALALAALAVFVPVASYLALVAFAVLLVRARSAGESKYAGLRVLR